MFCACACVCGFVCGARGRTFDIGWGLCGRNTFTFTRPSVHRHLEAPRCPDHTWPVRSPARSSHRILHRILLHFAHPSRKFLLFASLTIPPPPPHLTIRPKTLDPSPHPSVLTVLFYSSLVRSVLHLVCTCVFSAHFEVGRIYSIFWGSARRGAGGGRGSYVLLWRFYICFCMFFLSVCFRFSVCFFCLSSVCFLSVCFRLCVLIISLCVFWLFVRQAKLGIFLCRDSGSRLRLMLRGVNG